MIRQATREDSDLIVSIEQQCFFDPWPKDAIINEIEDNEFAHTFVYEENNTVIGFIIYWILFDTAQIINIAFKKECQKRGLGTELLQFSLNNMKEANVEFVSLEVRVSNLQAIGCYEKLGFSIVATRENYYSDNNEDAYLMVKGLGE